MVARPSSSGLRLVCFSAFALAAPFEVEALPDGAAMTSAVVLAQAAPGSEAEGALKRRREAFQAARDKLVKPSDEPASLADRFTRERKRVEGMLALAREHPDLPSERRELLVRSVLDLAVLAQMARFSLDDASTAAALYEQALAIEAPSGPVNLAQLVARLGYADLARFDLRDPARAVRLLRETRNRLKAQVDLNNPMTLLAHPTGRWIDAEIAFLESRRRAAVPSEADCAPIGMAFQFGSDFFLAGNEPLRRVKLSDKGRIYPELSRNEVAAALAALRPSTINLMGAVDLIPTLGSSDRVLAFARKHDPTGFLTACALRRLRDIASIPNQSGREAAFARYRWTAADARLIVSMANHVLGPVTRN